MNRADPDAEYIGLSSPLRCLEIVDAEYRSFFYPEGPGRLHFRQPSAGRGPENKSLILALTFLQISTWQSPSNLHDSTLTNNSLRLYLHCCTKNFRDSPVQVS